MSDPQAPTPSTASTPAHAPVGNVAPASDEEVVFYIGSPKLRGEFGLLAGSFLAFVICVGICVGIYKAWHPPAHFWWWYLIFGLLGIIALIVPAIWVKRDKYRISNYRIDIEKGLLNKRIDSIELWHVDDVQMSQTLLDRILRVGTVTIYSRADRTDNRLPLKSLPEPRKVFDQIKQRVIAVKRQRGVMKIDGGGGPDLSGDGGHHHG